MALRRKSAVLIALLLVLSLIAAACGGDDDDGGGGVEGAEGEGSELEPVEGGTIIMGAEQEPAGSLNVDLACCTLFWGVVLTDRTLLDSYKTLPDFTYAPELLEGEAEVTEDPFSITYTIKEEAQWSDGTPVSADDYIFTFETTMDPKNDMATRAGYDQIEDFEKIDEKTIKFNFKEPYAGWKDALFNPVYPAHALEGENFNKVWVNGIDNPKTGEPLGNGPFLISEYNKGADLTWVPNENWWGEGPYLDEVVWRFIPETPSEIQALRGGEVDAIYPQPQLELAQLQNEPGIEIQSTAGTTWEHIDFQYDNPLLAEDYVRQAIGYGIDREALVQQLFKDIKPDLTVLNNLIYMSNASEYEEHFDMYAYDPEKSTQLLEDNGCTKSGQYYECNGETLSFGFKSTAGNALRELAFQVIQEQLKQVGIELKSEFGDAAVVFGNQGLAGGKYDIFMFAWVGNPDPSGSVEIHKCEGTQNFQNYCNEEVTDLLEQSDTAIDPAERADFLNQADELMAEDLPILPLYQKPTFFAYNTKLQNAIDNATQSGPGWNAEQW
ncbi:MAG: peptide ABC transporter substrate-binding protein, partial [Actinomycetota bacterium]